MVARRSFVLGLVTLCFIVISCEEQKANLVNYNLSKENFGSDTDVSGYADEDTDSRMKRSLDFKKIRDKLMITAANFAVKKLTNGQVEIRPHMVNQYPYGNGYGQGYGQNSGNGYGQGYGNGYGPGFGQNYGNGYGQGYGQG